MRVRIASRDSMRILHVEDNPGRTPPYVSLDVLTRSSSCFCSNYSVETSTDKLTLQEGRHRPLSNVRDHADANYCSHAFAAISIAVATLKDYMMCCVSGCVSDPRRANTCDARRPQLEAAVHDHCRVPTCGPTVALPLGILVNQLYVKSILCVFLADLRKARPRRAASPPVGEATLLRHE